MNSNKDWTKFWKFVAAIALALSAFAVTLAGIETFTPSEGAVPRSTYQCAVYTEQGCAKFVVADGGEIEVQSGGTMDVQSGAATTFGGDVTIAGTCTGCSINQASNIAITGTLEVTGATSLNSTLDVDGATTLNSTLDVDGNISSGTGAVTVTDDVNVTGTVDFDSTLNVDGATTIDSLDVDNGDITLQNDETIGNSTDGLISFGGGVIFNTTTITVTDGQTITPTIYSGYRLNAAGAVTITLAACSSDFQPLLLYGEDAQTITINDTNVRTNDGGIQALGQYDLITWMCIGAEWVEVSDSNNS